MGYRPTYWVTYNGSMPYSERVEGVLQWLHNTTAPPSFITMYFEGVDTMGHSYGPLSNQTMEALKNVDDALGLMLHGTENLKEVLNIIIVSDHGMTQVSEHRVIFLDDYIDLSLVHIIDWNPIAAIIPLEEHMTDEIYTNLSRANNMTVYRKDEIPERYHYRDNIRITPILAVADLGWSIASHPRFIPSYYNGGNHGYDNKDMDMKGVFIASGPLFDSDETEFPEIVNIDIYSLLAKLLELEPAPNNGTLEQIQYILKKK
eukprot:TRINITY_DN4021_c0_g1_i2.p1 TRINITY_DN4021_c0_g1~~TRINITY_DN4021_c0_g1_i2.p1  ORF type:complete len:260 (-),score=32.63 TRINITY_DN4021_c0_g1_i2:11-790(-)